MAAGQRAAQEALIVTPNPLTNLHDNSRSKYNYSLTNITSHFTRTFILSENLAHAFAQQK